MGVPPIVVMGVSGSGKTTIAEALAARVGDAEFIDADDLHPRSNVDKMAAGRPLDDVDRAPWLDAVGRAMRDATRRGRTPVIACSALKRAYRRRILAVEPHAFFVLLAAGQDQLMQRMHARRGHFMPISLLASQLGTLEPLTGADPGITIPATAPPTQIVDLALARILALR